MRAYLLIRAAVFIQFGHDIGGFGLPLQIEDSSPFSVIQNFDGLVFFFFKRKQHSRIPLPLQLNWAFLQAYAAWTVI